jgi:hypothetical protein
MTEPLSYPRVLYRETQRFRQVWLWAILIVTAIAPCIFFAVMYFLYPTGFRGHAWSLVVGGIAIVAAPAYMALACLHTEVNTVQVIVRFFPLRKRFPHAQIESYELIRYHWMDFGGWGVKWVAGTKITAYTVSGDRAVRLRLRDGRIPVIGTQRPDAFAAALDEAGVPRIGEPAAPTPPEESRPT